MRLQIHLNILELACNQLETIPESFGRLTKVPKIVLVAKSRQRWGEVGVNYKTPETKEIRNNQSAHQHHAKNTNP